MQSLADRSGIILSVNSSSGQIWADSDRVVQTLTNLIGNAIKFSKPGDTVIVEAQPQGEEIIFAVKDTGRGIPEDKLETIFERFQQVDASDSRRQDGTGLGLAICKSIIQQHNGRIWVESVLNQGSKFYFALSLFKPVEIPELQSPSTQKHTSVLVCEDDPTIRTQLKAILEQQGYRVITVNSGEDGNALRSNFENCVDTEWLVSDIANNQNPEVILLDLLVPNLKGWEVMAILKKPSDNSNIPMIICSVGTTEARNQSTNPFVDWVCQPVEEHSLFQLLQQLLTQSSKPSRLLIVEDDPKIAELLVTLLNADEIEK
jgi:CheY-like chemotaxis protein